jgi:hypothetical protein
LGAIVSPVRHWVEGSIDSVHDTFLSIDGRRVHDMEHIEDRPQWTEDPSFVGDSLGFLKAHLAYEAQLSALEYESTRPEAVGVDELVESASEYQGTPFILIGKLYSSSLLGGDSLALDREEGPCWAKTTMPIWLLAKADSKKTSTSS